MYDMMCFRTRFLDVLNHQEAALPCKFGLGVLAISDFKEVPAVHKAFGTYETGQAWALDAIWPFRGPIRTIEAP